MPLPPFTLPPLAGSKPGVHDSTVSEVPQPVVPDTMITHVADEELPRALEQQAPHFIPLQDFVTQVTADPTAEEAPSVQGGDIFVSDPPPEPETRRHFAGFEPAAPPPEPSPLELPPIGRALFEVLTGAAGSGKSWASKAYVAESGDSAVLASSTGISAVNLGGEATTINALLGYFDEDSLRDKILGGRVQGMIRRLRTSGVRRIILDEISMISAGVLDLLVYAVQECNKDLDVVHHPEDHVGMTLVGDFCLAPDTPVMCFDGTIIPAREVRPQMLLMGPDGRARRVQHLANGFAEMYRVDQTNGDSYVCTGNHQIAVKRSVAGSRRDPHRRYKAWGDSFCMAAKELAQKPTKFRETFVGYKAGVIPFAEQPVTIPPYFLGLWLGDGDWDGPRITTADPEIIEVCQYTAQNFSLKTTIHGWDRTKAVRIRLTHGRVGKHTNHLWEYFRTYDLERNKHIPQQYLQNSAAVRLQLLAGLLDSDGNFSGGRYRITLKSTQLAREVKRLADQLGFRATLRPTKTGYWVTTIGGDTWRIPCKVKRKISKPRRLGRSRDTSVLSITPIGRGSFVGFGIDGDHLFLLGDGTVTHNCQLPPVEGKYAFEAGCWEELFAPNIHRLTRIWRQDDPAFIDALRAARRADVEKVVSYFGPTTQLTTKEDYEGITVFGTNAEVARWNDFQHQKVAARPVIFETKRGGQQKPEWKPPNPNGRGGGHIPDHMGIKPGARVMILANEHDRSAGGLVYSNGDLGTFEGQTEQEMEVGGEYKLVKMAVVRLMRNGEQVGVPEVTRLWETPSGALGVKKPKMDVLGWVKYMPIRLAYASSVHKTQGLSMDKVQIAIAHKFFASPAMLYVALSRARSMAGLRLVGTPQLVANRCTVDPKVKEWL